MPDLIIDNFAGGGGASTGIEMALGRSPDYAINHDAIALAMHAANHPHTTHLCKSVFDVDPVELCAGRPVGLAWFSPDCTHFSKARGGKPASNSIRDLAWVVIDYASTVKPRVIILENVEEFKTWGPLGEDNRPDKARAGETFSLWLAKLRSCGYEVEWRELRACDYGAPTIRKRFFLIARCDGAPIVWPAPTHGDPAKIGATGLLPWRTAAEIIDWSLPCPSIFERKRPLADKTLDRIARGLRKFVFEAAEPFIVTYYGPKRAGEFRGSGVGEPIKTQTTENRHALVVPSIIGCGGRAGQSPERSTTKPVQTITAKADSCVLAPVLVQKHAHVSAFLAKHYSGAVGSDADTPTGTVTAVDHHSLVTSHLTKFRGTCAHGQRTDEPMPTICSGGTHIGEVRAFLLKYYGEGTAQDLRDPMHTLTSKAHLGLVTIHGEEYQIADIGLRMLQPHELFAAQGFPTSYIIDRGPGYFLGRPLPASAQVRMVGNSVCPPVAAAIVAANCAELRIERAVNE